LDIFRNLAQKSLDIRQYACGISIQSDEKSHGASSAQSLCGIPYNVNASVLSYARGLTSSSNVNTQNLAKALYLYNQAAVMRKQVNLSLTRRRLCIQLPNMSPKPAKMRQKIRRLFQKQLNRIINLLHLRKANR